MSQQLQPTIQTANLTLADWLLIAGVRSNSDLWGFYAWMENNSALADLTQEDIQAIACRLDRKASWVTYQLEEHGWSERARNKA